MGAVIVLLPADPGQLAHPEGDPPEDLHVTMLYLGDEIEPEQADEIVQHLHGVAQVPPIEAKISGAGILGDDAAIVTILESQELCDLRTVINERCQGYTEDVAQFPSFIPHLTIGYPMDDDEIPDVELGEELLHHALPMVGDTIILDRLALLNGDDHIEIPLGAEAPAEAEAPADEPVRTPQQEYVFGRRIAMADVPAPVAPAAPAAAPSSAGATPPTKRTVILVGMPVKDPTKVPAKPARVPYMSEHPYVALLEVKLRKDEVPEQLAQVLAVVHVDPATSTCTKSLTASDTKPPRRAVLMDPEPLAAASEAVKAALAPYSVNVDDYPFVVQLGQDPAVTKADVTALNGQSIDFENLIAVLEDGTIVYEGNADDAAAPAAEAEGSPAQPEPATTVAAT